MNSSRQWLAIFTLVTAPVVCTSTPAFADDGLRADTPRLDTRPVAKRSPLNGRVSVHEQHAPALQRTMVAKPTVVSIAPQRHPLNGTVNTLNGGATGFAGVPIQAFMDRDRIPMQGFANRNPFAMQAQQNNRPKWTNPDDAPYRWGQCGTGGYYDTTGTYKGPMVWGDKLASFGGRFFDGTPVPKGEVKINSMGHIWWQNQLSNNFVRHEDARRLGLHE